MKREESLLGLGSVVLDVIDMEFSRKSLDSNLVILPEGELSNVDYLLGLGHVGVLSVQRCFVRSGNGLESDYMDLLMDAEEMAVYNGVRVPYMLLVEGGGLSGVVKGRLLMFSSMENRSLFMLLGRDYFSYDFSSCGIDLILN